MGGNAFCVAVPLFVRPSENSRLDEACKLEWAICVAVALLDVLQLEDGFSISSYKK